MTTLVGVTSQLCGSALHIFCRRASSGGWRQPSLAVVATSGARVFSKLFSAATSPVKVVHVPYTFWPDAVGGTEVYVDALAREQNRNGIDALVAAPGSEERCY